MMKYEDLPNISPELIFVLNCSKYPNCNKERLNLLLASTLNWNFVIYQATYHGVLPLVYKTIQSLDSLVIPQSVKQSFTDGYKNFFPQAILMGGETIRLNKIMEENGVEPLFLKGAPLAEKLYQDITLRPSSDIDILVEPHEFTLVDKILKQNNYQRFKPYDSLTPNQEQKYLNRYQHFEYYNPKNGVCVELHRNATHLEVKGFSASSDLKKEKTNLMGSQVNTMSEEEWLIYLILHGSYHIWFRLKWLVDIGVFMQKSLDWDRLKVLADTKESVLMVHFTLILVNKLLSVPIPDSLYNEIAHDQQAYNLAKIVIDNLNYLERKEDQHGLSYFKNFFQKYYYHLCLRAGIKRKLKYLVRNITSRLEPVKEDYQLITLPDRFSWLYYIIRPFNLLKRRFF